MYVVISNQGLPGSVITIMTSDARKAIKIAREIKTNEKDNSDIFSSFIYEFDLERQYSKRSEYAPLLYELIKLNDEGDWNEKFFDEFRQFNRKKIDRGIHKASARKFMAVVMFDSDAIYQIDEETNTREEAYDLCVLAAGDSGFFQVYDDQGVKQVD